MYSSASRDSVPTLLHFTLLLLLSGLPWVFGEADPIDSTVFDRIDTYLIGQMKRYGIPGMAVGIIGNKGMVYIFQHPGLSCPSRPPQP